MFNIISVNYIYSILISTDDDDVESGSWDDDEDDSDGYVPAIFTLWLGHPPFVLK